MSRAIVSAHLATRLLACLAVGAFAARAQVGSSYAQSRAFGKPCGHDESDRVVLPGHVPVLPPDTKPLGLEDGDPVIPRMILTLKQAPGARARMERFLAEQVDPSSVHYHEWLTPNAFGERFGASMQDKEIIRSWLVSQGFTVEEVSPAMTYMVFSGPASTVTRAFGTPLETFRLGDRIIRANRLEPTFPAAIAERITGIIGLNDIPMRSHHHDNALSGYAPASQGGARSPGFMPLFALKDGSHALAPADFATFYDLNPLYKAVPPVDGSNVTIGIIGATHPITAPIDQFRATYNLPANTPTIITAKPGQDPGEVFQYDLEAYLDMEWAGAVAKNAKVRFFVAPSDSMADIEYAAQALVNENLSDVISVSCGWGEKQSTPGDQRFWELLWAQAAAQGISVCVASGDSGPTMDLARPGPAKGVLDVSELASTPFNVAVGGTMFHDTAGTWDSNGNAVQLPAEEAWNETALSDLYPPSPTNSELWASGGGTSSIWSKPSWQTGLGVPADGMRDLPDVALPAAMQTGYVVCVNTWPLTGGKGHIDSSIMAAPAKVIQLTTATTYPSGAIGGTSGAAPSFAGIMALVVQKVGHRVGNPNPVLYQLAANPGLHVFHDITGGNTNVPGCGGFLCTPGYDKATGLGSVDVANLVNYWSTVSIPFTVNIQSTSPGVVAGYPVIFFPTVKGTSMKDLAYSWDFGDGTTSTAPVTNHLFGGAGTYNVVLKVTDEGSGAQATASVSFDVLPPHHIPPVN